MHSDLSKRISKCKWINVNLELAGTSPVCTGFTGSLPVHNWYGSKLMRIQYILELYLQVHLQYVLDSQVHFQYIIGTVPNWYESSIYWNCTYRYISSTYWVSSSNSRHSQCFGIDSILTHFFIGNCICPIIKKIIHHMVHCSSQPQAKGLKILR